MPSYCCFFCPTNTFEERSLDAPCKLCGRPFGFPLQNSPDEIGEFKVLKPLGRGFYAATYVAERKAGLKTKVVLKVTPRSFYEFFKRISKPSASFIRRSRKAPSISSRFGT